MKLRPHLIFGALVLVTGCDHTHRVAAGRIELTRTPVRVLFDTPVAAEGPTRELCIVGSEGNMAAAAPGGTDAVSAVLLGAGGVRDTMDTGNVERRSDDTVCFWDHGLAGRPPGAGITYTGVELAASHHVRAREVRWWSGQRRKWLF